MKMQRVALLLAVLLVASGCATVREVVGLTVAGEPSVNIKSAETRWLLIKNPRYGDVRSEPEYVWVEEDKVPTTLTTIFRGKSAIIAAPEIVAKYGTPPGGGKISPRQGVPYQTTAEQTRGAPAGSDTARATGGAAVTGAEPVKRGFVVYVDTTRVVIDLTSADGVKPGSMVSLRRDRVPIVHPVTGEVLGELDEEVATARVIELRERFSVAEVQTVAAGAQIQVRDRVVLK
ncbi:MAG: FlgT C-terminal domain-containing protein [Candidatus Rokuibacteriota bacterium]